MGSWSGGLFPSDSERVTQGLTRRSGRQGAESRYSAWNPGPESRRPADGGGREQRGMQLLGRQGPEIQATSPTVEEGSSSDNKGVSPGSELSMLGISLGSSPEVMRA